MNEFWNKSKTMNESERFEYLKKRIGETSATEWLSAMQDKPSEYSIEELYVNAEMFLKFEFSEDLDEKLWLMLTSHTNVKNKAEFFEKYQRVFDEKNMDISHLNLVRAAVAEKKREIVSDAMRLLNGDNDVIFKA